MEQHVKKTLIIVLQICILYIFSYIGNVIQNFFHLVIPGSILGLLLLFTCLCFKIVPVKWIENGAGFLLSLLMLFFIPTTVGVMNYSSLLSFQGALFILAVLLSTVISIAITGTAGQFLEKKAQKRKDDKECSKAHSQSA
ncbi:CidA/LrgA family holin-like protein [Sporosarcina sp. 179-K 8C2 HS]|uniref:CidA/LrgA family holin-like protein n=1 Tax=Sporosarcina sp. 179-K 8C2 HS TaxID=3142387 RepID=UPI0039A2EB8D